MQHDEQGRSSPGARGKKRGLSRRAALKRMAAAAVAVATAGLAACVPQQGYGGYSGYSSYSGGYSYSSYGSIYGSYCSVFYDRGGPDNNYHSQFCPGTNNYYTSYSS